MSNRWNTGFTGLIDISNNGSAVSGWEVCWEYTDGSARTSSWNATVTGSSSNCATNLSWNGALATGQRTEFGIQGNLGIPNQAPAATITVCEAR